MTEKTRPESVGRRGFLAGAAAATGAAVLAGCSGASVRPSEPETAASGTTTRWGFLIDLRRCVGCKACTVACKAEFDLRLGEFRSSVKELEKGDYPKVTRLFLPWLCNHCANPVCVPECPVDPVDAEFTFANGEKVRYAKRATYQRPDGPVLVDQDRCIGCGTCVEKCPYEVRYLDPVTNKADKCTLCVHRLDQGVVPSCVNTCQGGARFVGNLADPKSTISRMIKEHDAQVLLPEDGTEPRCYYVALDHDAYDDGRDVK